MDRKLLEGELYELSFYAGMNRTYHERLVDRYAWRDRAIKITLGLLTVVGFGTALLGFWSLGAAIAGAVVSFLSLAAAVVLNIVPFDAWERRHEALRARWLDLEGDVSGLQTQLKLAGDDGSAAIAERLPDLVSRRNRIEAVEPPGDTRLIHECQEDENERRWGSGVRTDDQVRQAKAARDRQPQPA